MTMEPEDRFGCMPVGSYRKDNDHGVLDARIKRSFEPKMREMNQHCHVCGTKLGRGVDRTRCVDHSEYAQQVAMAVNQAFKKAKGNKAVVERILERL